MSTYQHDLHKFSDAGLQLRLPVDLIPSGQYSQLTNVLPVIEGELRTRSGLTLVATLTTVAAVSVLSRATSGDAEASIATTIYPHGFSIGDSLTLVVLANSPTNLNKITLGTYAITIVTIPSPTSFTFTPLIFASWNGTDLNAPVFAQALKTSGAPTTLTSLNITTIFRLNQALTTPPGDRLISLLGRLFRITLSSGSFINQGNNVGASFPINSITRSSGNVTAILSGRQNFFVGDLINISGVPDTSFDGNFAVDEVTFVFVGGSFLTHLSWLQAGSDTTSFGGTLTAFSPTVLYASLIELVHPTTSGEPPSALNGFSSNPLSIISFRFTDDPASWAIIADQGVMYKYRESGNALAPDLFFLLGNPFPAQPATATATGTGNLDSTGGALYDWRYTYYDAYVNTEGNPSPSTDTGSSPNVQTPTNTLTPDPSVSGGPFPLTNNAFTSVTDTGGTGNVSFTGGTEAIFAASCVWFGFSNPATTPFTSTLSITWQATFTDPNVGNNDSVNLQYSLNNGASYTTFDVRSAPSSGGTSSTGTINSTVTLPLGADYTQVRFRALLQCASFFGSGDVTAEVQILGIEIDSNLSPVSTAIAVVNQEALVCVTPPSTNDGRVTGIRLYRRGGSLPDAWRLVGTFSLSGLTQGTCGAGTLQITDNVSDTQLSTQPELELDNDAPVTSVATTNQPLSFIWGPVGLEARVLGCGDPNRPESVYFSKPGNPDAWPPENHIEVCDPGTPIIAGCVYNTRVYAFSREGIYELVEGLGNGAVFSPFKTPSAHGLYTPWGLALGPAIFFISKDGIYATTGGQETSIVENDIKPLFPTYDTPGEPVENYDAIDYSQPNSMRLNYYNDELWFIYMGLTTQTLQLLIYDLVKKRWRGAAYASSITTTYTEPATTSSLLLGTTLGQLTSAGGPQDITTDIQAILRTGAHDQGAPLNRKQYGNVIFDLDPGGANTSHPVTITPYINGEAQSESALTITGSGRQQVPLDLSDFFAFNVEFQIAWDSFNMGAGVFSTPILFQYDVLWFPEPASVTHWESQPSSLEMLGYFHVRDMYVALRSNAPVTLTMFFTTSGNTTPTQQTYAIPSTGGVRQKFYIQLAPNKGLLYNWSLDSTEEFRVYVEDVEVRTKSWLSVLGYSVTKPFGAEGAGANE